MNPPLLRVAPLVVMLLLATALAFILLGRSNLHERDDRLIGYHVKAFEIPGLNSTNFSPAVWQGRVALLNVFASWCKPCAAEHETLMKIAKSGKVAVYGIAWKDKPKNVEEWIKTRGNPYQSLGVDEQGKSTVALALTGVPETFLFDKTGAIAYHFSGALTDDMADKIILPLAEKLNAQ